MIFEKLSKGTHVDWKSGFILLFDMNNETENFEIAMEEVLYCPENGIKYDTLLESHIRKWEEQDSAYMLDLYSKFHYNVGFGKKFRTKRAMYEAIALELTRKFESYYTSIQVESRYKSLQRKSMKFDKNTDPRKVNGSIENRMRNIKKSVPTKSTFQVFGDSIVSQLNELPEEEAYLAMADIQLLLAKRKVNSLRKY